MNRKGEVWVSIEKLMRGLGEERWEEMEEYEMVNPVHRGEFRAGSSFAWEVRTNTTRCYSGGSTGEKSQPENSCQSSSQGPPPREQPHGCLTAPAAGRAALARLEGCFTWL